jgi:diguanylate cyclase (GGDEF)-like protein
MRLAVALLLLFVVGHGAVALSPDMRFHQFESRVWSLQEGLPQVTVQAVVQGPDGYLWAGTQAGLARFDGARFETFEPENEPAILTLNTQALFLDSRQRLWVGTTRGPVFRRDKVFHRVAHPEADNLDVHAFAETDGGAVLVATDSGLWRYADDAFSAVDLGMPVTLRSVFHHEGHSLAGARGAIFEARGGRWQRHALPAAWRSAMVTGFARHDGRLWAGTTAGLLVRDDDAWHPAALDPGLDGRLVEVVYTDRDGTLWVGTAGRLFRLHQGQVIDRWAGDGLFEDGNVLSVTEDHEGNLWLGSRSYGLARLWDGYVLRFASPEGLHEGLTWTLARDPDGSLWVGTADGLSRFDRGRFERQVAGKDQPHPHAYSLLPERGRVWVGTRSGLYWWLPQEGRIVLPRGFEALAGSEIRAIQPYQGAYWLGTSSGIWRWDGDDLNLVLAASEDSAHQTRILLETRDGRLLAGTQGGVMVYREQGGFAQLSAMPGSPDILSLIELTDGRLVAGNRNEQLLVQHEAGWRVLGEKDGVPANAAYAMVEREGELWVGGNRGLYRLSLAELEAFLDGIRSDVPTQMILSERGDVPGAQNTPCCNGAGNARVAVFDDALWFTSRDGLVAVNSRRIERNALPPALHIDRVRIDQRWRRLRGREQIRLAPDQRSVDIGFAGLSFQDPGSVHFAYRMLGLQDDWQALDPGSARIAFYTNLPPGDLRFQLRGSNNAGVWSEQPVELAVRVAPRWFETGLARALAVVAIGLLVLAAVQVNARRMKHRERALNQLIEKRTDELRVANHHLREYSRQLEAASMTDPLTGLWNRRYFSEEVRPQLRDFHRYHAAGLYRDRPMLVALLDLDFFKRINDDHGHDAGDRVLRDFADFLRGLVHPRDHVLRWGGEEFLLVFQPLPESEVLSLATRLRDSLRRRRFSVDGRDDIALTCSMGLSLYPACADGDADLNWELALALADKGLYACKNAGRDTWYFLRATGDSQSLAGAVGDDLTTLQARGQVSARSAAD